MVAIVVRRAATSFRLSHEARGILVGLSGRLGVSQTGVVEIALRKLAQSEGYEQDKKDESEAVRGPAKA